MLHRYIAQNRLLHIFVQITFGLYRSYSILHSTFHPYLYHSRRDRKKTKKKLIMEYWYVWMWILKSEKGPMGRLARWNRLTLSGTFKIRRNTTHHRSHHSSNIKCSLRAYPTSLVFILMDELKTKLNKKQNGKYKCTFSFLPIERSQASLWMIARQKRRGNRRHVPFYTLHVICLSACRL